MKYVAIVGILAVSGLLAVGQATHTPKSATAKSATPDSDTTQIINIVRNGYLAFNKTITIGQALAGTFQDGGWKVFRTEKGAIIVEFDGTYPFVDYQRQLGCDQNLRCAALNKKLTDYCNSPAGQDQPTKDYYKEQDKLVAELKLLPDTSYEFSNLQAKMMNMHPPENPCFKNTYDQHANDPIPVVVQFSINHDGTFQYRANDMGLSVEALFEKIYQ